MNIDSKHCIATFDANRIYKLEILKILINCLEILNMGLYDKTSWKRWGVRELLSLGYTLGGRSEIESTDPNMTMEFSSSYCDFIRNLVKQGISFDCNEVNIPWRFN